MPPVNRMPSFDGSHFEELDLDRMDIVEIGVEAKQDRVFDSKGSFLKASTDPFEKRTGKTLMWRNVNMTLNTKKGARKLLDNVWGEVPAGETTAIMGPSGAGKSSLLNILAGRSSTRGSLVVEADVRLNNYSVDPTNMTVRKSIAFVAQDDSLQVTATPREAIRFSAKLRLPRSTTESQLDKLTTRMITELGLTNCADTIVGGALIKGISGGERKRTSVGVELVTKPPLVFLDEPTSGLDSFSSVQLCQVLKKVANSGASVLFTIHQPSSEIFASFDRLILLNRGRVMYQGLVTNVPDFFEARGRPVPVNYNPADWVMAVAQSVPIKELDAEGYFPEDKREIGEAFDPDEDHDELGITLRKNSIRGDPAVADSMPRGFLTQIGMLFKREIVNLKRDVGAVGARFGLTLFMSILVGIIFWKVGESDPVKPSNLQSHFGSLVMVMLLSMFGSAQPALLAFPSERPVFLREYSTNHYSVMAYFVSKFTMEAFLTALQILLQCVLTYFMIGFQSNFGIFYAAIYCLAMASTAMAVMLGSAVEDPKLATELLPILFVPQMLFAGFFVATDLIPAWLRWAQYLCSLTYGVRILLVEEFEDCGGPDNEAANAACNGLLQNTGANPDSTWWNWLVLLCLFVAFRTLALIILRKKATKFF